jgi:hypothetical protein
MQPDSQLGRFDNPLPQVPSGIIHAHRSQIDHPEPLSSGMPAAWAFECQFNQRNDKALEIDRPSAQARI